MQSSGVGGGAPAGEWGAVAIIVEGSGTSLAHRDVGELAALR